MFKWDANNIIDATCGRRVGNYNWICSSGISTDTRNIKKGDLFIALKGKNFDGYDFLHEAFSKGAVAAIVSDEKEQDFPLIIVDDTLKALHNMASYYIKNVLTSAKVIAITGSVGKTTTKDMLHTVLSRYGTSHVNDGNLNNNIGLPLTVLKAPEDCQYLILEMGMSKAGEIKELSEICNPDIAVITNIEPAHTENFSSLFDVAQAKLEVLHGMKSNGALILNKDSDYYDYLSSYSDRNIVSFGRHQDAAVCLLNLMINNVLPSVIPVLDTGIQKKKTWIPVSRTGMTGKKVLDDNLTAFYTERSYSCAPRAGMTSNRAAKGLSLKIKLSNNQIIDCNLNAQGEHFAYSALAVAAVIQSLGLDSSKLPLVLETFNVTKGRGNVHKIEYNGKHICLIDDSYNASPASMKAAIKTLSTYSGKRKVALLGDMLELGDESAKFHTELLDLIVENNVDKVYTVGKFMLELQRLLPSNIKGAHFDDSNQLKGYLTKITQDNDIILVKGSRGMQMDLVVQEFIIEY